MQCYTRNEKAVLVKRTISACIAIPLISTLIYWGSARIFFIIILITAGLSLYEFFKMSFSADRRFIKALSLCLGLGTLVAVNYYRDYLTFDFTREINLLVPASYALIVLTILLFSLMQLMHYPKNSILRTDLRVVFFAIGYVCLFLSCLLFLRDQAGGVQWIFFVLFVLWLGDSGAYCVGKAIGRRKLLPAISPNKTVEGAVGGLLASLLTGFACKAIFLSELAGVHCFFITLAIALSGQVGDLCESTFKRLRGVKDSGTFLPGHGGILDRIDSLLFAAPVAYYYKVLLL
jgi:phosphatidate cytidylyltransferase